MKKIIVAVGLLFGLFTASTVNGQIRDGFWVTSGIGVGSFNGDGLQPVTGPSGYFGGGVFVNERLSLGVEGSLWRRKATTHYVGSAVVYVHPRTVGGPFLKGLFGWGRRNSEGVLGRSHENGKALGVGLGYDLDVGVSVSLRAYVNASLTEFTGTSTMRELGVGLSWQPG